MQRTRKYLTPHEIETVLLWTKKNVSFRDYCLVLLAYRHGLRPSEATNLKWENISFEDRRIYIHRLKGSKYGFHVLQEEEVKALSKLRYFYKKNNMLTPYVFVSFYKPHTALTRYSFSKLCKKINSAKIIPVKVTPHSFRHSCGYYLANKGYDTRLIQDYLGHKDITNTAVYTAIAEKRFAEIKWK